MPHFDAVGRRKLARGPRDAGQIRRLLSRSKDGAGRDLCRWLALGRGGVGLQIVRDWVVRFNAEGPDGLTSGRPWKTCCIAIANHVRLVLQTAAYWLMLVVREAIPRTRDLANGEFAT